MKHKKSIHKKEEKTSKLSISQNDKKTLQRDNCQSGLLIGHFGATALVENDQGQIIHCHLRKNSDPVMTGDRVLWQKEGDHAGIIVDFLPRKSLFTRPERHGKIKLLAANVDIIIIVIAPKPPLSEFLLDRYLVAAENLNITPIILFNKKDLLTPQTASFYHQCLSIYEKIGYKVIYSSTLTKDGLDVLNSFLQSKTCVLVGTSGVGKSSIIAGLTSDQTIKVGETTETGLGKHTTSMTRLYHTLHGADLIDSPGVREFNLWNMSEENILKGFIEFAPYLNQCKFRDCKHLKEPNCAIQKAVDAGVISQNRFSSYRDLITKS